MQPASVEQLRGQCTNLRIKTPCLGKEEAPVSRTRLSFIENMMQGRNPSTFRMRPLHRLVELLRIAEQPRPYVDGPAWQALCDATSLWRLQSYVRPVDAASKPAGHYVIRFPGFSSALRARSAGQGSEYPGLRFAGSSSPHFALAKFDAVTGKSWVWIQLSSGRGSSL